MPHDDIARITAKIAGKRREGKVLFFGIFMFLILGLGAAQK
jgi:hypothetical protein